MMAAELGRAAGKELPRADRVAVIAALALERVALNAAPRGATRIDVHQSGPGLARAEGAARAAIAEGANALVAWGLAGGLIAGVSPGDVVLPALGLASGGTRWRAEPRWHAALERALSAAFRVHTGTLVSVPEVLASPLAKRTAAESCGAAAVDMESAAIAAVASHAGIPFIAVRVVADASTDSLPHDIGKWIDASGRRRLRPLLGTVVAPGEWPTLLRLASRQRAARRTLDGVARHLVPSGFHFTQATARA
jgi:adenosylhomocysteine nucleosidase